MVEDMFIFMQNISLKNSIIFDADSFTNNEAYNIAEQAGMNYFKSIYMSGSDGPENLAWLSFAHYHKGKDESF